MERESHSGQPIAVRLTEFYRRLAAAPRPSNAAQALRLVADTLNQVEDELSGSPREESPPTRGKTARMYPPLEQFIDRRPDGSISARTRRHIIEMTSNGGILMRRIDTLVVEFER